MSIFLGQHHLHHPYVSPRLKGPNKRRDAKNGEFFYKTFYEDIVFKKTDFVMAGHDHFLSYLAKVPRKSNGEKDWIDVPQIISGAGGEMQKAKELAHFNIANETPVHFRETGFVQMKLLTSSDDLELKVQFNFIHSRGDILHSFERALKRNPK